MSEISKEGMTLENRKSNGLNQEMKQGKTAHSQANILPGIVLGLFITTSESLSQTLSIWTLI